MRYVGGKNAKDIRLKTKEMNRKKYWFHTIANADKKFKFNL